MAQDVIAYISFFLSVINELHLLVRHGPRNPVCPFRVCLPDALFGQPHLIIRVFQKQEVYAHGQLYPAVFSTLPLWIISTNLFCQIRQTLRINPGCFQRLFHALYPAYRSAQPRQPAVTRKSRARFPGFCIPGLQIPGFLIPGFPIPSLRIAFLQIDGDIIVRQLRHAKHAFS